MNSHRLLPFLTQLFRAQERRVAARLREHSAAVSVRIRRRHGAVRLVRGPVRRVQGAHHTLHLYHPLNPVEPRRSGLQCRIMVRERWRLGWCIERRRLRHVFGRRERCPPAFGAK